MSPKRDISLTLALCLSLTAHAWVVHWVAAKYAAQWSLYSLAPIAKPAPIAVETPPPMPQAVDRMAQLGDDQSSGSALASSEGDTAQTAPRAEQNQASLSLDPEGTGGEEAPPATPPAAPPAFAMAPTAPQERTPKFEVPGSSAQPADWAPNQKPAEPRETKPSDSSPDQPVNPRPTPPQTAQQPGDPAPQADSESDAFSTQQSVEFRRGKTVARLGRKHRLISPRLEMAAYADLLELRAPVRIVLRLYLDTEGNVTKADIVKSSGSINLDQPTRQAAYKWWFEPPRDSIGGPRADVFEFVVGFG